MSSLFSQHFNKNSPHHAYLLEGNCKNILEDLRIFFQDLNINTQNNPDFFVFNFDTFKIDDARNIKSLGGEKSFQERSKNGLNKIIIISANNFLQEAQNTLLKILEEPNPDLKIFIITPDSNILLKTIISRLYKIIYPKELNSQIKEGEAFIKMSLRERLSYLKENFSSKDEEEGGISLRSKASIFLNSLENILHEKFFKKLEKDTSCFEQIFIAREYLRQNGTSPKGLLEGVAITTPEL